MAHFVHIFYYDCPCQNVDHGIERQAEFVIQGGRRTAVGGNIEMSSAIAGSEKPGSARDDQNWSSLSGICGGTAAELDTLIAAMPFGLVFLERSGERAWVNPIGADLLKLAVGQHDCSDVSVALQNLQISAVNAAFILEHVSRFKDHPEESIRDWLWLFGDPLQQALNVFSIPVTSSTISGRLWIFHDVTSLHQTNEELVQLNATKDRLFSIISHDLRGLVGVLNQGLEMLADDAELDTTLKNMLLDELKRSSKSTYLMLENLLTWFSCQTQKVKLEAQNFPLIESVEEAIELLQPIAKQKAIDLHLEICEPLVVFADRDSVTITIRNLLSNSIKFTPKYGRVSISAAVAGNSVEVHVDDNGVGMSHAVLANLFKPQSYFSTPGTRHEKGFGIGLMVCKELIERWGGTIHVQSREGQGSQFIFTMPKGNG